MNNKFKIFLRSGTVVPIIADRWWSNANGFLYFYKDDEIIGHFAAGMWEGIQDVSPREPTKKIEESGS